MSRFCCLPSCWRDVCDAWVDYCAGVESQAASQRFRLGRKSIKTVVPTIPEFPHARDVILPG